MLLKNNERAKGEVGREKSSLPWGNKRERKITQEKKGKRRGKSDKVWGGTDLTVGDRQGYFKGKTVDDPVGRRATNRVRGLKGNVRYPHSTFKIERGGWNGSFGP